MIPAHVTRMSSDAARRDRRFDRAFDVLTLGHVAAHRVTTDRLRRLLRGRLVEVRDDDGRPLLRKPLRRRGADALGAAGHEHCLPLESHAADDIR